ncbi:DUF515 domain-containing protein [bacterium]|nr:DUF515 domain-containing protein [bacterium]
MKEKTKRELLMTGLVAPWAVVMFAVLIAYSASQAKRRAIDQANEMEASKVAADRQLAEYVDQRELFRRDCEQIVEQGKKRLEEASAKEARAELALLNTEALLKEFGYSADSIRAFQSLATDGKRISSLIAEKAHRHLPGEARPTNGNIVRDTISSKNLNASLTMINGLHEDAYVKLVHNGRCVASFYVRGDNRFTFSGIPDGDYFVMYCLGFGWDTTAQDFKRGRTAVRYDDTMSYRTRVVGNQFSRTTYSDEMSLTLHKTAFGNATTTDIDPAQFDKY